ncbi:MAG: hypothetical protein NT023_17400 [Armatimonadetes bacterium]|nr:hypothetical protein [Armatimonadota bacterium]
MHKSLIYYAKFGLSTVLMTGVFLLTLALLGASSPSSAHFKRTVPNYVITVFGETNAPFEVFHENKVMGFCAVVTDIDDNIVTTGSVLFSFANSTANAHFSFQGGGATATALINGGGQACVRVTGTGHGYVDLNATYTPAMGQSVTALVTVTVTNDDVCVNNVSPTPPLTSPGPYRDAAGHPLNLNLTYKISTTHLASESQTAIDTWNSSHLAKFIPGSGNVNMNIIDVDAPTDASYARAPIVSTNPSFRTIKLNLSALDPCPANPSQSMGAKTHYPPASARLNKAPLIAHEIGHCLGLFHNTSDNASLMWGGPTSYWLCGTTAPTPDEEVGLVNWGYTIPAW